MLRKNWLLKIRHPFATCAEILLPTIVMLMLVGIRSRVDTQVHPVQAYIQKGMFVEVGNSEISPSFDDILKLMIVKGTIPVRSEPFGPGQFHNLWFKLSATWNFSYPKIKGAIVFHTQGPQIFDYSIRLNHTWAFSGFPDAKTIMDVNGPYLNDLELGVNVVPTLQYGFSGFLTLQKVVDSLVILLAQHNGTHVSPEIRELPLFHPFGIHSHFNLPWTQYSPANISIAPFPTREYTDDEFQSIVKSVMGVL
ncbi:ABC transporter A, ABCA [Cocos nucifera]|uniref:ABC transporter A, ABCA n=1 Tax=Cocos nucifera TaxID=13894 RepID=A0A8K0I685_COCNU|nr:ABC transporter A, ABCA [Cocos nucifera]